MKGISRVGLMAIIVGLFVAGVIGYEVGYARYEPRLADLGKELSRIKEDLAEAVDELSRVRVDLNKTGEELSEALEEISDLRKGLGAIGELVRKPVVETATQRFSADISFRLSVRLPETIYRLGEAVEAQISLTNTGREKVYVWYASCLPFPFSVVDEEGEEVFDYNGLNTCTWGVCPPVPCPATPPTPLMPNESISETVRFIPTQRGVFSVVVKEDVVEETTPGGVHIGLYLRVKPITIYVV